MQHLTAEMGVAVYARTLGSFQWICPDCASLNIARKIRWRRAHVTCSFHGCRHSFRVGIRFQRTLTTSPPFNAEYVLGTWDGGTVNRFSEPGDVTSARAVARLSGPIQWVCPDCGATTRRLAEHYTGSIACRICGASFFVSALLYTSRKAKNTTPIDWIPPFYEAADSQPLRAPAAHPRRRTASAGA